MDYKKIIVPLLLAVCFVAIVFMGRMLIKQNGVITRLDSNVTAIAKGAAISKDSSRADVKALLMTVDEIKAAFPTLKEDIKKDFNVKLKRLESYTKVGFEVNARVTASVYDSIMNKDTLLVQKFGDKYLQYISVLNKGSDSAKVAVVLPVVLDQVVYKYKPPGWPFGWGWFKKRQLMQSIKTDNPYVKLNYNQYIKLHRE